MYHSVTFMRYEDIISSSDTKSPYTRNTYDDWALVPTSRPDIKPPEPKTKYVDIPGSNGQLDFSTSLTGYPVYQNRTGSWEFMIDLDHTKKSWSDTYSDVMDWIQGKDLCCILEDDQSWYYKGRFHVSSITSESNYTTIQIEYNVYPYKRSSVVSSNYEDWLWDSFDFIDGIIPDIIFTGITVNSDEYTQIRIKTKSIEEWYSLFGTEPVVPLIKVTSTDSNGIDLKFQNKSLGKPEVTVHLEDGDNTNRGIIFGGICLNEYFPVYYKDTNWLMGDVNGDGKINAVDASEILQEISRINEGHPTFNYRQNCVSDVDGSGKLNQVDASIILSKLQYGDYTKNGTEDYTISMYAKGHGTISFCYIPGRL